MLYETNRLWTNQVELSTSAEKTPNRPESPCILLNPTVHWNVKEIPPLGRIRIRSVHVTNPYFLKSRLNLRLYEDYLNFNSTFTFTLLI
jgi:hypothetical protein